MSLSDIVALLALAIDALVAYFISRAVYRRLKLHANKFALVIGFITFIASFLIIAFAMLMLVLYTIPFER